MNIPNKRKNLLKIKTWMKKELKKSLLNKKLDEKIKKIIIEKSNNIFNEWNLNQKEFLNMDFSLVHFDYDSSNILIKNNKISGIIDFDDIIEAPTIIDLGFSLWWWLFFNFKKNKLLTSIRYIKGYSKIRKLNDKEKKLLPLIIRMRNMILLCLLFINEREKPEEKNIKKSFYLDELLTNNSVN
jgi:Ser/Thr protein kinase RdoA (MazF antagonist)